MFSAARLLRPARCPGFSIIRGRTVLVFLLLIAFSLQGVVAQTHIHGAHPGGLPVVDGLSTAIAGASDQSGLPSDDEEHCLLCQAVALSSGLSTPAAGGMPLLVQLLLGVMALLSAHALLVRALGHEWHQRAPPRP